MILFLNLADRTEGVLKECIEVFNIEITALSKSLFILSEWNATSA